MIVATESFTDTIVIEKKDVERLRYIMNQKKNIKLTKVRNHKFVTGKEVLKLLKLDK